MPQNTRAALACLHGVGAGGAAVVLLSEIYKTEFLWNSRSHGPRKRCHPLPESSARRAVDVLRRALCKRHTAGPDVL
jgi:hypothetical protein